MIDFNRINDILDEEACDPDDIDVDADPREPTDEEAERQAREELDRDGGDRKGSPPPSATETLDRLLDRLRRGEGDVLFSAGESFDGFEYGPEKITVLGAPPGAGKTALTMQLVIEAMQADPELRVFNANAEMPFDVLLRRELTRLSGVPAKALRFADLRSHQMEAVETAASELRPLMARIEVMHPPFTIEALTRQCLNAKPGLMVIDYLQKFAAGDQDARQGTNAVMAGLRILSFAGWGILALSATARRQGKGGSTHDSAGMTLASFKESGEIEFNADACYLLRDDGPVAEGDEKVRNVTLDCVKNRHGERDRIELVFDMPRMTFRSREPDPEPHDFGEYGDNPFANASVSDQLFDTSDDAGAF